MLELHVCSTFLPPNYITPHSAGWEVEIIVQIQMPIASRRTIRGQIHPNTIFPKVARYVNTIVNPPDQWLCVVIEIDETGEQIKPEWGHNMNNRGPLSTIGSSTLKVPVKINYIVDPGRP